MTDTSTTPPSIQFPRTKRQAVAIPPIEPLAVNVRVAGQMIGKGRTAVHQLIRSGELPSYLDGSSRLILVSEIRKYVERKVAAGPRINEAPGRNFKLKKD